MEVKRYIIIICFWFTSLCAAISGSLILDLIADRYLTDRAYDRTEWMVKNDVPSETPSPGTLFYQHEQNMNRKEGINSILKLSVPIFVASSLASLLLLIYMRNITRLPNKSLEKDAP